MRVRDTLRSHRRLILSALIAGWIIAATMTHIPQRELPNLPTSDTTLHFTCFFILGSLFWLSLLAYGVRAIHRVPVVILILMIYAAIDETTQAIVNRTPALDDWIFDSAGAIVAVAVWEILRLTILGTEPKPVPPAKDPYEQNPNPY
jgi:VanZ family protein